MVLAFVSGFVERGTECIKEAPNIRLHLSFIRLHVC